MTIKDFIKKRPYLIWYVSDVGNVSKESIVESVLNFGTFEDVKKMIDILGLKNVSRIFFKQIGAKRNNYRPEIKNYFRLYFKKYA